jgi:hypothetical protein
LCGIAKCVQHYQKIHDKAYPENPKPLPIFFVSLFARHWTIATVVGLHPASAQLLESPLESHGRLVSSSEALDRRLLLYLLLILAELHYDNDSSRN